MESLAYLHHATAYEACDRTLDPRCLSGHWGSLSLRVLAIVLPLLVLAEGALAALQQGDRGTQVTALQNCLQDVGYFNQNATGYFGSATRDSVTQFQRDRGLQIDGIAGRQTLTALGCSTGSTSVTVNATGDSPFAQGGDAIAVKNRYVVMIPTNDSAVLNEARFYRGDAFLVKTPLGSYVQLASYPDRRSAELDAKDFRKINFRGFRDAHVRYF